MAAMADIDKKTKPSKKRFAAYGGLTVVTAIAAFMVWKPYPSKEFISIVDMPDGLKIEGLVEAKTGTSALTLDKKTFHAPESFLQDPQTDYRIRTTLKMPQGSYRDIVWSINIKNSSLHILADGFTNDENITLRIGKDTVFQNVNMDWSGRIEIETALPQKSNITACIELTGQPHGIGLCHTIPQRRPA